MGTFDSFRKAYGALKDTTKVGLAKVNSEFKDLDIAIVKATNHVECPPKERHVRKIFSATSVSRPRADVAYCIHALAKRLSKTKNWIVAIKILIVIHRTLREGDPAFREELLNYSCRGHILQISNFKDDSSPLAWDCSAWVRTYALFLEERLECFRVLKYDIETERLAKPLPGGVVKKQGQSRPRHSNDEQLLEELPALQQLVYRLIGCQPEGAAAINYLVLYALALVLKESFKIYCAINDGIINLVDRFFEMSRHDAIKALNIYKRAGQQAQSLAEFYEYCKRLELSRNFQFPTLRQPPSSFLLTMEEYIKEAPKTGSVNKRLEYEKAKDDLDSEDNKEEETEDKEPLFKPQEEEDDEETEEPPKEEETHVPPPLLDGDLLGLTNQIDPRVAELMESNALALAILPSGNETMNRGLPEISGTGWELALVSTPSNMNTNHVVANTNLGGGFDKLLLDSLYEDESSRRQIQMRNAGYSGYESTDVENAFEHQQLQHDPFMMSNNIAPPTNVQMAMLAYQQQQYEQQMMLQHQQQQQQMLLLQQQQQQQPSNMLALPYYTQTPYPQQSSLYPQQQMQSQMGHSNPFGDPFNFPPSSTPQQGNHFLL